MYWAKLLIFKALSRRENDKNAEGNREESRSLKRRVSISNSASTYVLRKRDGWTTKNEMHVVFQRSVFLENELLRRVYGDGAEISMPLVMQKRENTCRCAPCALFCVRMRMCMYAYVWQTSLSRSSLPSHRIKEFQPFRYFPFSLISSSFSLLHFSTCST